MGEPEAREKLRTSEEIIIVMFCITRFVGAIQTAFFLWDD